MVQNTSYVHLTKMDIQIDSEIHHLSFFRCIGYKSDFPFLYYANALCQGNHDRNHRLKLRNVYSILQVQEYLKGYGYEVERHFQQYYRGCQFNWWRKQEESGNSDGQQFHHCQQNEQSPLTSKMH